MWFKVAVTSFLKFSFFIKFQYAFFATLHHGVILYSFTSPFQFGFISKFCLLYRKLFFFFDMEIFFFISKLMILSSLIFVTLAWFCSLFLCVSPYYSVSYFVFIFSITFAPSRCASAVCLQRTTRRYIPEDGSLMLYHFFFSWTATTVPTSSMWLAIHSLATSGCCLYQNECQGRDISTPYSDYPGSNLGPETGYSEFFLGFPQFLQGNAGIVH
jgi:hypothetical protein